MELVLWQCGVPFMLLTKKRIVLPSIIKDLCSLLILSDLANTIDKINTGIIIYARYTINIMLQEVLYVLFENILIDRYKLVNLERNNISSLRS